MLNKGSDQSEPDLSLMVDDHRRLHNSPKPCSNSYTSGVPLRRTTRVSVRPWKPPGLSPAKRTTSAVPATCKARRKINSDERKLSDHEERHDDSNAVRTSSAGPNSVASPTLGTPGMTSRKIQYSGKIDSSVPAKKNVALQRRVIQKTAALKDRAIPVQSRVVVKSAVTKVATVPIQSRGSRKTAGSKDAAVTSDTSEVKKIPGRKEPALPIQRRGIQEIASSVPKTNSRIKKTPPLKVPALSIRRTGSTKTSVPHQVSHKMTKKTESPPEPSSEHSDPVHYISCDDINKYVYGWGDECNPVGQKCPFCEKDFSCAPQDEEEEEEEEEEDPDEYKYEDQFELFDEADQLRMLPAIDILPCGHAFHSECLQLAITEEQFSDPPCILCLSLA